MRKLISLTLALLLLSSPVLAEVPISLGIKFTTIDWEAVRKKAPPGRNDLPKDGLMVNSVTDGLPVAAAGIKARDVLFSVGGKSIKTVDDFKEWAMAAKIGTQQNVLFYRMVDGKWAKQVGSLSVEAKKPKAVADPNKVDPAKLSEQWEAEQAKLPPDKRPFEIKGDRLGMSLDSFKSKYHRLLKDDAAPFCSDRHPELDNPFLLYKAGLDKAGIIHGRTTFPYEEYGIEPKFATIAGVNAQWFVYKFVDGKLYEMNVLFKNDDHEQVLEAMRAKFGDTTDSIKTTLQNALGASFEVRSLIWANDVSEITLTDRAGSLEKSLLTVRHKELEKLAAKRTKEIFKPRTDDL